MKHEDKVTFLKVLQKLDDTLNIREGILSKLKEELNNKVVNEKEKIVLDLVEGISESNSFFIDILKEIKTNEIIDKINKRVSTNNPDEIRKIEKNHILLVKTSIKDNFLGTNFSENYIANILNILENLNSTQQIYNYFNNYNHPNFQNTIQKIIFTENTLIDLFFLNILNLYQNDNLNEFLKQSSRQNQLKVLIASYIRISERIKETKKLLVPLSIVMIFANIYNQMITINNFGQVNTNEIFRAINQNENLDDSFAEYLKILKELNLLYGFLNEIESSLSQINENYINKILKIILDNGLYSEKLLIDFCILFSSKVPNEYKKTLTNKNKENEYWYKDLVLENLSSKENILHDEALKFLQFVENWQKNKELKEKVKEFIKNNINQLLEKDNIFNIYKILIENGEQFELNYTLKDIGRGLIAAFMLLDENMVFDEENEKLIYIFKNVDKLFKEKDLNIFKSKLFEEIIDNLEKFNKYQLKTLEKSESLLRIDKNQIENLFKKLIDIRDNENPFLLFMLVIENNKRKLNKDLKNDFKEKLQDIKENVENKNITKIIDEILDLI